MQLRGGLPGINRDGQFSFKETFTFVRLQKSIYGGGHFIITASKNRLFIRKLIFGGRHL